VGCGKCRQLPHNHFEVRNSILEKLLRELIHFLSFFQISPDGTDNIRHEGCQRLGPTSSGVRIKIIVKIIPNVKLKGI
jgi:hypothetical protein